MNSVKSIQNGTPLSDRSLGREGGRMRMKQPDVETIFIITNNY
jgi:hypothetical protein